MNNYKITLALAVCLFGAHIAPAQLANRQLATIALPTSKQGWVNFRDDVALEPATVFSNYKEAFNLGENDEMKPVKSHTDALGYNHYRFEQYYKGILVYGGEYILHQNAEKRLYCANGKLAVGINKEVLLRIDENTALSTAKRATGAKSFAWESDALVRKFESKHHLSHKHLKPIARLIWVPVSETDYVLCYQFDLVVWEGGISKTVYINTLDGTIVKEMPLSHTCNQTTNPTVYNGNQTIKTTYSSFQTDYYLLDDCDATEIYVMDAQISVGTSNAIDIWSGGASNTFTDKQGLAGAQTLWNLKNSVRYFKKRHGRDSYDGTSTNLEAFVRAAFPVANQPNTGANAMYESFWEEFFFGYGLSDSAASDDYVVLDVAGHEFTHAVISETAGLKYEREPGAINESFADIFGEVIERYTLGSCDMLHGVSYSLRNMLNPQNSSFPQPASYYDTLWVATNCANPNVANDYCGVHFNSGVQNRMFALLCLGGSGTNFSGDKYSVLPISVLKAGDIAYRALTVYLTSTSGYYDAREAWIKAAEDLYGNCSFEAIQVASAWHAVAVGHSLNQYNNGVCGVVQGSIVFPYTESGINSVIGAESCFNIVYPSSTGVNYLAGVFVELRPGFEAKSGSNFLAAINPCSKTNYRLNENDSENHEPNSNRLNTDIKLKAAPNPFSNTLTVSLQLTQSSEITIQLFDILGKQTYINEVKQTLDAGQHEISLQTDLLPKGIYLLRVTHDNMQKTIKVIK